MICCHGQNTFGQWALQISMLTKKAVCKLAVFDPLGIASTSFAKQLLAFILSKKMVNDYSSNLFERFNNVLLQDTATLRLPKVLLKIFKENRSNEEQKVGARVQRVFNIKTMSFKYFSLGSFIENDQSASGIILPLLKKGDLAIRDLGYFAIATFQKIIATKAHFLSRLRYGVTISDEKGKAILLKDLLKQRNAVERWVYIGVQRNILVRLVLQPLPATKGCRKNQKSKKR
jgi:hypothetical protein